MPRKSPTAPRYCRQKENGRPDRAYTIVAGQRIHLGTYGSQESYESFEREASTVPSGVPTSVIRQEAAASSAPLFPSHPHLFLSSQLAW
jgi:hypothetical protein